MTGHHDDRRQRRRTDRRDPGAMFVELVVSVVILGAASVAVLTALAAATRTAEVRREVHDAHASLTAAGTAIVDARTTYVPCATGSDPTYLAAAAVPRRIVPRLAPVSIAAIEYWDGDGSGRWSSTCRYDDGYRLQRITLAVTVGGDRRELAVVKRPDSTIAPDRPAPGSDGPEPVAVAHRPGARSERPNGVAA